MFEAALKLPDNNRNEEFAYRAGQSHLRAGNTRRAKELLGGIAKNGKDPDWQKLAQQALIPLESKPARP
jgi:hypothetical protein